MTTLEQDLKRAEENRSEAAARLESTAATVRSYDLEIADIRRRMEEAKRPVRNASERLFIGDASYTMASAIAAACAVKHIDSLLAAARADEQKRCERLVRKWEDDPDFTASQLINCITQGSK